MKEMIAKYAGTCCKTGTPIKPGDPIRYHGKGRSELISRTGLQLVQPLPTPRKYQSAYFRSLDGREYYQNHKGRCEDAPCCGCCN